MNSIEPKHIVGCVVGGFLGMLISPTSTPVLNDRNMGCTAAHALQATNAWSDLILLPFFVFGGAMIGLLVAGGVQIIKADSVQIKIIKFD
jgi:hypothetical protein